MIESNLFGSKSRRLSSALLLIMQTSLWMEYNYICNPFILLEYHPFFFLWTKFVVIFVLFFFWMDANLDATVTSLTYMSFNISTHTPSYILFATKSISWFDLTFPFFPIHWLLGPSCCFWWWMQFLIVYLKLMGSSTHASFSFGIANTSSYPRYHSICHDQAYVFPYSHLFVEIYDLRLYLFVDFGLKCFLINITFSL